MDNNQMLEKWLKFAKEYNNFKKYVAENGRIILVDFRHSHYLTQKQAAEALGISLNYIGQIETNKMPFTLNVLQKMVEYERRNL